tara:strand:+ start:627 stop:950 length:324 start_codon:yes stop_codon:yes gene_type:complete
MFESLFKKKQDTDWKFDQPKNCAAYTTKEVLNGQPILYIFHDLDDHGWQFIGANGPEIDMPALVCMESIVGLDATVEEVAHMEPGYRASRRYIGDDWVIEEYSQEEE